MEKTKLSKCLIDEIYDACKDYVYTMNHNKFRSTRTEICIKICQEVYNISNPSKNNINILGLKIFREYDFDFINQLLAEKYRRKVIEDEFPTKQETAGDSN